MLRKYFLFLVSCFLFHRAHCQISDTTFLYYKFVASAPVITSSPDSADGLRVFYPINRSDNLAEVRDYFKNGKLKLIGKADMAMTPKNGIDRLHLEGQCIVYYADGKKQFITNYKDGEKNGLEYRYYPNGHVYSVVNYVVPVHQSNRRVRVECYDLAGKLICENGNGRWIMYDDDFNRVNFEGPIKDGDLDGEWTGDPMRYDSIRFVCNYKKGIFISGVGFDSDRQQYPFQVGRENAYYKNGNFFSFVEALHHHLVYPKDVNGYKLNIDTTHISFVIEKDGKLTDISPLGNFSSGLKIALYNAVLKCGNWEPARYLGIPFRTKIILPLKIKGAYENQVYIRRIQGVSIALLDFLDPTRLSEQ